MKIGICIGLDAIKEAEAMGFDYFEPTVNSITPLAEQEFRNLRKTVEQSSIKPETFCGFFPWEFRFAGPAYDEKAVRDYSKLAVSRISALGGKIAVVGNGSARRAPDGWEIQKVVDQFMDVISIIGEEASKSGLIIVVEPLNKDETNVINYLHEGKALVERINSPHVQLLADYYHMGKLSEKPEAVLRVKKLLRHVHIANPENRQYPLDDHRHEYAEFFKILKQIGYDDHVSIEASGASGDFKTQAPLSLKLLKELVSL